MGDDTNLEKVIHERDQLRSAIGKLAQLRQQEVESQKAFKAEIDANAEKMKGFERLQKKFDEQSNVLKKVKILNIRVFFRALQNWKYRLNKDDSFSTANFFSTASWKFYSHVAVEIKISFYSHGCRNQNCGCRN